LAWPYLLTPWRSPLIRWRVATFGVVGPSGRPLHADEIGRREVIRFVLQEPAALCRFLGWAASL
jgi:hypothetical protein